MPNPDKSQTIRNDQIPKPQDWKQPLLLIGIWELFAIWCLEFEISPTPREDVIRAGLLRALFHLVAEFRAQLLNGFVFLVAHPFRGRAEFAGNVLHRPTGAAQLQNALLTRT
jgi:hypothetical protein